MKNIQDGKKGDAGDSIASALKQVLAASPAVVRSSNAAAKAEPFSSHTRFVPRPAKAS